MAPIKFEDNIKGKLEERTLKPSPDAWNKLSERLDSEDDKGNKKPYYWLGLAASIIGILFVVSQFLNDEIKVNYRPIIVDVPEVIQDSKTNTLANEDKVLDDIEEVSISPEVENIKKVETQKLVNIKKDQELTVAVNEHKIISKKRTNQIITTPELPIKTLTFEEQKIQDVVAQVQTMKDQNKAVTDADIEALLEAAQKEIISNRLLYNETTGVVDANALLQDVEAEINQSSFRNKVFEALKSSYNSVKTAVAQRND